MPVVNLVDAAITYRILRMLVTPWDKTEAYNLGIIDAEGNPLKKASELQTPEEEAAYTVLVRLVFKLKRILGKIPLVNKNLATFAAALWLVKECLETGTTPITEEGLQEALKQDLTEQYDLIERFNYESPSLYLTTLILEDAAANNVGGGNIAGTQGDAGRKAVIARVLRRNKKVK